MAAIRSSQSSAADGSWDGAYAGSVLSRVEGALSPLTVTASILSQSIALPLLFGGQVSIILLLPAVALARSSGVSRSDLFSRLPLALAALVMTSIATFSAMSGEGDVSAFSLLHWLLLIMLMAIPSPKLNPDPIRLIFRMGLGLSVLAIVQLLLQILGAGFVSIHTLLPDYLTVKGYNSITPWYYGSQIIRSTGFFMLEPSFASQFMAIGLLAYLSNVRRPKPLLVLIPILGIASTVSGTGVLVLLLGSLPLLKRRQILLPLLVIVATLFLVYLSPLNDGFRGRISEQGRGQSSGDVRFKEPYDAMLAELDDGRSILVGAGPGAADVLIAESLVIGKWLPLFPTIPKLTLEYGLLTALLGTALIASVVLRANISLELVIGWLTVLLVVNGGPLQPAVYVPMWLVCCRGVPASRHSVTTGNEVIEADK